MSGTINRATQLHDAVGTTAANTTLMLNLEPIDDLLVVVTNGDAGTRALTMQIYDKSGTVLLNTLAIRTVGAGATETLHIGPGALATGITAAIAVPLPMKAKLSLAAGTTSSRLTVIGR
jgi:hypothetical protein